MLCNIIKHFENSPPESGNMCCAFLESCNSIKNWEFCLFFVKSGFSYLKYNLKVVIHHCFNVVIIHSSNKLPPIHILLISHLSHSKTTLSSHRTSKPIIKLHFITLLNARSNFSLPLRTQENNQSEKSCQFRLQLLAQRSQDKLHFTSNTNIQSFKSSHLDFVLWISGISGIL